MIIESRKNTANSSLSKSFLDFLIDEFSITILCKDCIFLDNTRTNKTRNFAMFGFVFVKSSYGVVNFPFFRNVLTGTLAKIWHAYKSAKCVKDSSTLAWTINVFLMRQMDWKVLSKMEFISKCLGAAKVNFNWFSRQYFWNFSDVKTEPKSDWIRSVNKTSMSFLIWSNWVRIYWSA